MKNISDENFAIIIKNSISIAGVLKNLNLNVSTGNYRSFYKKIKKLNLSIDHFLGQHHSLGKTLPNKRSLDEILIQNSDYSSIALLKKRLLKRGLLIKNCYLCGIIEWQGKPLSLQLDHINGIYNDHRIENLRLLCPNCHSQTETFAGKNKSKNVSINLEGGLKINIGDVETITYHSKCELCGELVQQKNATTCLDCYLKNQPTKINWPNKEILRQMVEATNYTRVAEQLGVSDNAIRKRLKNH